MDKSFGSAGRNQKNALSRSRYGSLLPAAPGKRLLLLAALLLLTRVTFPAAKADTTAAVGPIPSKLDRGGVVLTFDDRNFGDWIKALPLLDEYNARATFFISGVIDGQALDAARQLQSHGHAIGAHGVHHLRAVEYCRQHSMAEYIASEILPQIAQLKAAGIAPTAFGYPNSNNNAATDAALLKVFRHLRTGLGIASGEQVCQKDAFFVPADKIGEHGCLQGKGIDFAPTRADRTYQQLDAALARAATKNEVLVLYAHQITVLGKGNYVTPEALEHVLRKAKELQLPFYTFDQLP
jgi:peptidoglycan-N-acetylglucosamine deacetylase